MCYYACLSGDDLECLVDEGVRYPEVLTGDSHVQPSILPLPRHTQGLCGQGQVPHRVAGGVLVYGHLGDGEAAITYYSILSNGSLCVHVNLF